MLLQSPVSSAKRMDKDKLLMTARVKVTRLRRSQLQHKTRILIQPKVDPEDVRYDNVLAGSSESTYQSVIETADNCTTP